MNLIYNIFFQIYQNENDETLERHVKIALDFVLNFSYELLG